MNNEDGRLKGVCGTENNTNIIRKELAFLIILALIGSSFFVLMSPQVSAAPTFDVPVIDPEYPNDVEPVNVSIEISDNQVITSATLYYSYDGSTWSNLPMTLTGAGIEELFNETFPSTTIDSSKWSSTGGSPQINTIGINEPSTPYSLDMNGASDVITSVSIDLSTYSDVTLNFSFEPQGGGDNPESNNYIWLDYYTSGGSWSNLWNQNGDMGVNDVFFDAGIDLPPDAHHTNFRFRFWADGDSPNYDDWFIDDIKVISPGAMAEGQIPGPGYSTWVYYYINATNQMGQESQSPTYSYYADGTPPVVLDWTTPVGLMSSGDNITIFANVTDDHYLDYVLLWYGNGTTWTSTPMSFFAGNETNATYRGDIPPAGSETTIYYYVEVYDKASNSNISAPDNYMTDYPPTIENIINIPEYPNGTTLVKIYANINDADNVSSVTLHYSTDGVSFTSTPMVNVTGDLYNGTIPATGMTTILYYFITASDTNGVSNSTDIMTIFVDADPPVLGDPVIEPEHPNAVNDVNVTVSIIDQQDIVDARIYYTYDGGSWYETTLSNIGGAGAFYENYVESGPVGWIHYNISGPAGDNWGISSARSVSPSNSWYSGPEQGTNWGDSCLESPVFPNLPPFINLTFWHWYDFYPGPTPVDGGIVEINNGSGWSQIFPVDGYDTTLQTGWQNPIEGYQAFTFSSGGWLKETFNLSAHEGEDIQIRFRIGWIDVDVSPEEGWYIDNITLESDFIGWKASIPGPGFTAWVDYYVQAKDQANNTVTSAWYSYFADGTLPDILDTSDITGPVASNIEIPIFTNITDDTGIDFNNVYLWYDNGSGWVKVPMGFVSGNDTDATFCCFIPKTDSVTTVYYYVQVEDVASNANISSTKNYVTNMPPMIQDVFNIPTVANATGSVAIYATITDGDGIGSAFVHYSTDGLTFVSCPMTIFSGNIYNGTIPAIGSSITVYYYIEATDNNGFTDTSSVFSYLIDADPPIFGIPSIDPKNPTAIVNVNVSIPITDNRNVSEGKIFYSYDGSTWNTVDLKIGSGLETPETQSSSGLTTLPCNYLQWDTQNGGSIGDGGSDAYDGAYVLYYNDIGAQYSESAYLWEAYNSTLGQYREILFQPETLGSLDFSRKFFAPYEGYWGRYIDTVINPTSSDITIEVRLYTNLGSDSSTITWATEPYWAGTDDNDGSGDPSLAHVFGPGGSATPSTGTINIYYSVTIPAGSEISLVTFAIKTPNRAWARTIADDIASNFESGISVYSQNMNSTEMNRVANWDIVPADLGFNSYGLIPGPGYSTWVHYYIQAKDRANNTNTTSIYRYYADGTLPTINTNTISSPVAANVQISIVADVIDDYCIDPNTVFLYYDNGSGWTNVQMSLVSGNDTSATFQALVPATNSETTVNYYVQCMDNATNPNVSITRSYFTDMPPIIDTPFTVPSYPNGTSIVNVFANITDNDGISSVTLYYSSDGVVFVSSPMDLFSGDTYNQTIPSWGSSTMVYYYISATDNNGFTRTTPIFTYFVDATPPTFGVPTILPPTPNVSEDVNVNINIMDDSQVANATLYYSYDGVSWSNIPMTFSGFAGDYYNNNVESGTSGWTHYSVTGPAGDNWVISSTRSMSPSNSWYSGLEPGSNWGDSCLESPWIFSLPESTNLTFWHWYEFYPGYEIDGGIVEINTGSGWQQIFPDGGYPDYLRMGYNNPLEGLDAYTLDSSGWEKENFNLSAYAGMNIKIRFHVGWNDINNGPREGWYIDDIILYSDTGGWQAPIPGPGYPSIVYYYISAEDTAENANTSAVFSYFVGSDITLSQDNITFSIYPVENGTFVDIEALINNIGGSVSNVEVRFYLGDPDTDSDRVIDVDAVEIGTPFITDINSNGHIKASTSFITPDIGTYEIYVWADALNGTWEYNEWNNLASKSLKVYHWVNTFDDNAKTESNRNITIANGDAYIGSSRLDGTNWTKQGMVMDIGPNGAPDDRGIMEHTAIRDDDGKYKLWYSAYDGNYFRIMYAESANGIAWTKIGVVLDIGSMGAPDDYYAFSPAVIKDYSAPSSQRYKMWYTGYDGSIYYIMYATSPDGLTWSKQGVVLNEGSSGQPDDGELRSYEVIKEDSTTYKMWYSGYDGSYFRICYATSPDGISWTKQGVVMDLGASGSLDDRHVNSPSIVRNANGGYYMWYSGYDGSRYRILYASSLDGTNWKKHGLALNIGPGGSYDDYFVYYSDVILESDGNYKMWYSGNDGSYSRLMYATLSADSYDRYHFDFDDSDEGFLLENPQPYSYITWDSSNQRVYIRADRQDPDDEMFVSYFDETLDPNTFSWTLSASFAVTTPGNMQNLIPLFIGRSSNNNIYDVPNTIYFNYYSGSGEVSGKYIDSVGNSRILISCWISVNIEYHVKAIYDLNLKELTLQILDSSDNVLVEGSYIIGTSASDGFTFGKLGVGTHGTSLSSSTDGYGWTDDIKLDLIYENGVLTSTIITLPPDLTWHKLFVNSTEPLGTSITMTILDSTSGLPITGFVSLQGEVIDITGIKRETYPSIRLVANFNGNSAVSPILHYLAINLIPPVEANAGMDDYVDEDTPYMFDGSGSWSSVGISNYAWDMDEGDGIDWENPDYEGSNLWNPTHTYLTPGVYVVTLNTTDMHGYWDMDTVIITVRDTTAPVVDPGQDCCIDEDSTIVFDAGGSWDNCGSISSYLWDMDANDGFDWAHPDYTGVSPAHVFTQPGTYTVSLKCTDPSGNSDIETLTVIVLDITDPAADAGSDGSVNEDEIFHFDGSLSSDNVGILYYNWTFGDGSYDFGTNITTDHLYTSAGNYIVTLLVTDSAGNWNKASITLLVNNLIPTADAGPDQVVQDREMVYFDGGGSQDTPSDLLYLTYIWYFGDGFVGAGKVTSHKYSSPGNYTVLLAVSDNNGATSSDTMRVSVVDVAPPVADAGADGLASQNSPFTFDGSGSYDNIGISIYSWDMDAGDGINWNDPDHEGSYMINPTHTYTVPGTYTISLKVTDTDGYWDIDTMVLTVKDVTSPVAKAGADMWANQYESVQFDASASSDNIGIIKYQWDMDSNDGVQWSLPDNEGARPMHMYPEPGVYIVTLRVMDSEGNYGMDTLTIRVNETIIDDTVPNSPTQVEVLLLQRNDGLLIQWNEPTKNRDGSPLMDLEHYEIYYRAGENTEFKKLTDLSAGTTSYIHSGLTTNAIYYYYLVAVDENGISSPPSITVSGMPNLDSDGDQNPDIYDLDDDNDGHPDSEDDYPLDPSRWKSGEAEPDWSWILIIVVVVLLCVILLLGFRMYNAGGGRKGNEQSPEPTQTAKEPTGPPEDTGLSGTETKPSAFPPPPPPPEESPMPVGEAVSPTLPPPPPPPPPPPSVETTEEKEMDKTEESKDEEEEIVWDD